MDKSKEITPLGITNYRSSNQRFGIKDNDRLGHIYIIGKTGVGKSTLIKGMVLSDVRRGNGLCLIDPHGDMIADILKNIPKSREKDVVYLNPKDTENTVYFNPLIGIPPKYHHLVASGLVATFRKIWADSWGVRLEYLLRQSLLTLLWSPEATVLDIQRLLTHPEFRNEVLAHVFDEPLVSFWKNEFEKYSPRLRSEAISPILNKIGTLISSQPIRSILGRKTKGIRFQRILDEGKILLVNLSKGEIGEDTASILGCIVISSIQLAAMHRARLTEDIRRPFYLYIDECHSFLTQSIADIFAEARKYKLSLCMANQYIYQLQEPIRNAIFGNVGTLISFRIGAEDAVSLRKEFHPEFDEEDLINLPRYSMYIKLMIDGSTSKPFSAISLNSWTPRTQIGSLFYFPH